MFDKLVKTETREGTTVFVENEKIILLIVTVFNNFNMYAGQEARAEFFTYGLDFEELAESEIIAENDNIIVYFLEA